MGRNESKEDFVEKVTHSVIEKLSETLIPEIVKQIKGNVLVEILWQLKEIRDVLVKKK